MGEGSPSVRSIDKSPVGYEDNKVPRNEERRRSIEADEFTSATINNLEFRLLFSEIC